MCEVIEDEEEVIEDKEPLTEGTLYNGHEWVDLGLTEHWATCNVGANSPEEYGDYFAWGKVVTKERFDPDTGLCVDLGPFSDESGWDRVDVASKQWGGEWRIPSRLEMKELIENCIWTWVKRKGVPGYRVVSRINGNSIFLPAAGEREGAGINGLHERGTYWSSTPGPGSDIEYDEVNAFNLDFYCYCYVVDTDSGPNGYLGRSVRPVLTVASRMIKRWEAGCATNNPRGVATSGDADRRTEEAAESSPAHETVDLGLSVKWATCNVGAESPADYGDLFTWGDAEPITDYGDCETVCAWLDKDLDLACRDAARLRWGKHWRLPTKEEMQELVDNCDWTWTRQGEHYGCLLTSKRNGRSIFLPAAGIRGRYYSRHEEADKVGYYWTSTPYDFNAHEFNDGHTASHLRFSGASRGIYRTYRCYGLSIRPVSE